MAMLNNQMVIDFNGETMNKNIKHVMCFPSSFRRTHGAPLRGCVATLCWCGGFRLCLLWFGESHCMWIGSKISITKLKKNEKNIKLYNMYVLIEHKSCKNESTDI
jgi:hypothetical protein